MWEVKINFKHKICYGEWLNTEMISLVLNVIRQKIKLKHTISNPNVKYLLMLCNQLIANVESQLTKSQRRSLNKNHWTLYKMKILIEIFEDILLKKSGSQLEVWNRSKHQIILFRFCCSKYHLCVFGKYSLLEWMCRMLVPFQKGHKIRKMQRRTKRMQA